VAHNGTRRPLCLRLVLGVLVDCGVMRARDIATRMALDAGTAGRIVPKALARLSSLGLVIQHAGRATEWEATERGRIVWAGYADNVALELAAA
jgi:hypothetical protein